MTPEQVKEFAKDYAKEAKVKFVSKKKLSRLLGWALRKVSDVLADELPELEKRLRPMVIRIWRRTYIILPDEPGCKWVSRALPDQIELMVEEVAHALSIVEWVARGGTVVGWYLEYVRNPSHRAIEEGLANAAAAEAVYALTGKVPGPPKLDSYILLAEHINHAHNVYSDNVEVVQERGRGSSTFAAASIAIRLMKKHKIISNYSAFLNGSLGA